MQSGHAKNRANVYIPLTLSSLHHQHSNARLFVQKRESWENAGEDVEAKMCVIDWAAVYDTPF